jgi:CheY-like chemotaxis protein
MDWIGSELDGDVQTQLRRSLAACGPDIIGSVRKDLLRLTKADCRQEQLAALFELGRSSQSLGRNATVVGARKVARLCAIFGALLHELHRHPEMLSASCVRTMAQAVDGLETLFTEGALDQPFPAPQILVVEDEPVTRQVIGRALGLAELSALRLADPVLASTVLEASAFDLVFLDVEMPVLSGFDLCKQLRGYSTNLSTPVVFVTALTGFESRALSILSGGNDIIGKPFVPYELALKALIHVVAPRRSSSAKATATCRPAELAAR